MPDETDTDLTLPSVVAALSAGYGAEEVVLSIVFHPDTSRIGDWVVVPQQHRERHPPGRPWVLGRSRPVFSTRRGTRAGPLDDPHISRHALQVALAGRQLVMQRPAGASRCRVDGRELSAAVTLDEDRLRAGVPLLLGHAVVLLVRLTGQRPPATPGDGDLLLRGSSASMARVRRYAAQAAATDLDVLILGETGTGKELVAATIHAGSARAQGPLVTVNMAAIPPELAAAALFGSARGAFTGATRAGIGYFEQAQGGTLFLDEIGDTPPDIQPLLLRALQQREIQAVGGAVQRVDVRVISATDADLQADGSDFKAALRHRLAVCEIQLPGRYRRTALAFSG